VIRDAVELDGTLPVALADAEEVGSEEELLPELERLVEADEVVIELDNGDEVLEDDEVAVMELVVEDAAVDVLLVAAEIGSLVDDAVAELELVEDAAAEETLLVDAAVGRELGDVAAEEMLLEDADDVETVLLEEVWGGSVSSNTERRFPAPQNSSASPPHGI
jgi:hypothetical protein